MNRIALATVLAVSALSASCATTSGGVDNTKTAAIKSSTSTRTYQIAGHPYRSDIDCERKAPIGKFDARCDHPLLGYKNFSEPVVPLVGGGVGGLSF